MKGTTVWKQKNGSKSLKPSGPRSNRKSSGKGSNRKSGGAKGKQKSWVDSDLAKAGLAIAAGIIIGALSKGVKDSDYYD